MSDLPNDTAPAIQAMLDERLRRMTPAQRVHRALALSEASDRFALAKLRVDHPTASEAELRLRRFVAALGQDVFVPPPGPLGEGQLVRRRRFSVTGDLLGSPP